MISCDGVELLEILFKKLLEVPHVKVSTQKYVKMYMLVKIGVLGRLIYF